MIATLPQRQSPLLSLLLIKMHLSKREKKKVQIDQKKKCRIEICALATPWCYFSARERVSAPHTAVDLWLKKESHFPLSQTARGDSLWGASSPWKIDHESCSIPIKVNRGLVSCWMAAVPGSPGGLRAVSVQIRVTEQSPWGSMSPTIIL